MGAIQNTVNAALGGVARAVTAASGIGVLKTGEAAKGAQEQLDIETGIKENEAALKDAQDSADIAKAAEEKASSDAEAAVKELEATKKNLDLHPGSKVAKEDYELALKARNKYVDIQKEAIRESVNQQKALSEQQKAFELRRDYYSKRVDNFNKLARRRGLQKIKIEGGKK